MINTIYHCDQPDTYANLRVHQIKINIKKKCTLTLIIRLHSWMIKACVLNETVEIMKVYQVYSIWYNSTFSLINWCNEIYLQVWAILHVLPDWKRQRALNWIHCDNEYPNKIELFCIQNLVEI